MAHEIFNLRYYGRKPAWHNLGKVFGEGENPDLVEAFTAGRLNYQFGLWQTYAVPSEDFYTRTDLPSEFVWDGNPIEFEEKKIIVRYPTEDDPQIRKIEVVSNDYELMQNMEVAETFNELSKLWKVETVGALGKGETIFFTLDCGVIEIAGEQVKRFFIGTDSKTGSKPIQFFYCPYQVVCSNTLKSGLRDGELHINVKHDTGHKERVKAVADIAKTLEEKARFMDELFGSMSKVKFDASEFKTLVEEVLYPVPPKPEVVTEPFMKALFKVQEEQKKVNNLFEEYSDSRPGLAENLFGAFSVIVDIEDFRTGRGNSRYADVLFGKRAQTKALAFATLVSKM